jgi:hypothetical protein
VRERPYHNDWIQTRSGIAFPLLAPQVEHIDPDDIAHALSNLCRYGGHSRTFYSVAQHSVLIARWLSDTDFGRETALHGLLHDAAEAYCVDVPKPLKRLLGGEYHRIEGRIAAVIREAFGLDNDVPRIVESADERILADEREALMWTTPGLDWGPMAEPLGVTIDAWSPEEARHQFTMTLRELAP